MPTTLLLLPNFQTFLRPFSRERTQEENLAWMPVSLALYLGLKTKQQLSSGGVPRRRGVNKDGAGGEGAIVPPDFGRILGAAARWARRTTACPSSFRKLLTPLRR